MERFAGTVDLLDAVDIHDLVDWVEAIPFTDWPQQTPGPDGALRPAMVNDPLWHGFGAVVQPVVDALVEDGERASTLMLSVVMPGDAIPPHADQQADTWRCRVHIPLVADGRAWFIYPDVDAFSLTPGLAYRVNTERLHTIRNDGAVPRIHFMFDIHTA